MDIYRQAAGIFVRVLHGTVPADIPVEQPTKFELVLNLKIAKALGITISQSMLLLADKVIE
jgi:putative tryptophan/tyrosine transport system substrate-binding protein